MRTAFTITLLAAVTALVCAEHHDDGYGKSHSKKEAPKAVATGSNVFNLGLSEKGKGKGDDHKKYRRSLGDLEDFNNEDLEILLEDGSVLEILDRAERSANPEPSRYRSKKSKRRPRKSKGKGKGKGRRSKGKGKGHRYGHGK